MSINADRSVFIILSGIEDEFFIVCCPDFFWTPNMGKRSPERGVKWERKIQGGRGDKTKDSTASCRKCRRLRKSTDNKKTL